MNIMTTYPYYTNFVYVTDAYIWFKMLLSFFISNFAKSRRVFEITERSSTKATIFV